MIRLSNNVVFQMIRFSLSKSIFQEYTNETKPIMCESKTSVSQNIYKIIGLVDFTPSPPFALAIYFLFLALARKQAQSLQGNNPSD